jgi:CRISPR/Cas system-associated exonuclease Cas4 (RecB family)
VHKLLERVESFTTGERINEDEFAATANATAHNLLVHSDSERQALINEAYVHVQNFVRSNLATFVRSSPIRKSEFELQYRLDSGDRIFGILDRVLELPDGRLAVVDFKTDRLTESNRATKLARYRYQLLFYAYLLSKYSARDTIVGSLFFTRSSEHYTYDFTADDFADLESQFSELIATVRANERIAQLSDLARNEEHCHDCAYFSRSNMMCVAVASDATASVVQKPIAMPAM